MARRPGSWVSQVGCRWGERMRVLKGLVQLRWRKM
jgi:hypothetical protein